jgi:hypothetical protein
VDPRLGDGDARPARQRPETAARQGEAPVRKGFKREMHAAMIGNLARLGLLTDRVRPRLAAMGVSLPAN